MATKRRKYNNIVQKLALRQTIAGSPNNSQLPCSCLLPTSYLRRICIPLSDIQKDNAFSTGHVLLGFTRSGEYLMSYRANVEEEDVGGFASHTYTLHWWRFNLLKPLQEVCHISLFAGEVFAEELHLIVCHTPNDNRILIHGCSRVGGDDQSKQCFVMLCPSPPCIQCSLVDKDPVADHPSICKNSWVVHMKYSLLPPFPMFIPSVQLKLHNTILLNTVDSLLAVTVNLHANDSTLECHSQETKSQMNVGCVYPNCTENKITNSFSDWPKCRRKEQISCHGDVNPTNLINNNGEIINENSDKQLLDHNEPSINCCNFSHLSTFGLKTFSVNYTELDTGQNLSGIIDETSHIDIQVTAIDNTVYKVVESLQHSSDVQVNVNTLVHKPPCLQTQVVSLDVERYISEALTVSDQLKDLYWSLRNYSTQIIDVCHGTQCVVVQVISLIYVQPKSTTVARRRRCSISWLFSWNISNGEVCTLDASPLVDSMKKSDKEVFEQGSKRLLDLRRKCFVPSGPVGVQAFSNHTVFTATSLRSIRHPFQPIAIVL